MAEGAGSASVGAPIARWAYVRHEASNAFLADCLAGLGRERKAIPCKWLYDRKGSRLFELICETPEYYVSRIEAVLLAQAAPEIAATLRPDTALIEFGSGASRKTRILLDELDLLTCYVPIDICADELARATAAIGADYPWLEVCPIQGDFTTAVDLGPALLFNDRLGFFPGSTIGNFAPPEATKFLTTVRSMLGHDSRLIVGVDLAKSPKTLQAAYNDSGGVTAAFNKNLLVRANQELGANFDIAQFDHRAVWDAKSSRMEMHLVSRVSQSVHLSDAVILFAEGEPIHTEDSYKYSEAAFNGIVTAAGWRLDRTWKSTDPAYMIALLRY